MKKQDTYEDDGRTIADMSDVDARSVLTGLFTFRLPPGRESALREELRQGGATGESRRQEPSAPGVPEPQIPPGERRIWMAAAVRAALLAGLVYIGVIGGAIALMLLAWSR